MSHIEIMKFCQNHWSPIRIKEFKLFLNQKIVSKLSEI
jgi:hypothetical protein